jgi:cytosine/adenosine deaminase-related metal-dependent hydrolase
MPSYRARWVFPVAAPPLFKGTVEISAGRITAVHAQADPAARDLGNVALIPALVNAHTHLEFSDLTEPVGPSSPFTAWIRALVGHRRRQPAEQITAAIAAGLREGAQAGTGLLGEIATPNWSPAALAGEVVRTVVFRELLGLLPSRLSEQMEIARQHLLGGGEAEAGRLVRGLSPHAPYSVHPALFRAAVDLAAEHRAPLAIHLAETEAELELLARGTGEFVELLRDFGVWDPEAIPQGSRPLDYLRPLAKLARALVIHGNYLDADELNFLAGHPQIAVVYCPRTHAYFGHAAHPWRKMLQQGVSLAIGTDSRGSNPDLSLWRELQFLHARHADVDPAVLLRLGTLDGARALGCDHDCGSIAPGKRASLALVALPAGERPPYELLFAGEARPLVLAE